MCNFCISAVQPIRLVNVGIVFHIQADAFLHHMIRNIMGCLLAVGTGTRQPDWMRAVLQARDRRAAAPTFAPDGLYFLGPRYDAELGLPTDVPALGWLPGGPAAAEARTTRAGG